MQYLEITTEQRVTLQKMVEDWKLKRSRPPLGFMWSLYMVKGKAPKLDFMAYRSRAESHHRE